MSELRLWMREVEEPLSGVVLSASHNAEETDEESVTIDSIHLEFCPDVQQATPPAEAEIILDSM
jgi:hypothetical protein